MSDVAGPERTQPGVPGPDGPVPSGPPRPEGTLSGGAPLWGEHGATWASAPYGEVPPTSYLAAGSPNSLALASLVLGIMSVVFCWWGLLALTMIVLSIVFGVIGRRRARRGMGRQRMATAGVVLGVVGLGLYVAVVLSSIGISWVI